MHPSCRVGLGDYNRSAFMTKEIRFCLNADEAPALSGAYAIAIEFADKVAVTLSGRSPIVLLSRRAIPPDARDDFVLDRWIDGPLKDARSRQS